MTTPSAAHLAAATPEGRDRFIDFLRAASIAAVVFGHWLVAVVVWRDGRVEGFNALEAIPGYWPLTWVLQVMPIFFFVGGFSNLISLRASRRRGEGYAGFLRGRFSRLMRPTIAFLVPAVVVVAWLDAANVADAVVFPVASLITGPLWFLGVYLIVIALTPPMAALHDRFGARIVVAGTVAAIAVDVVRFGLGVTAVGFLNYPVVWLLAHQWGFLYADHSIRPGIERVLAPVGLAATAALVAFGPYPESMVGLATDAFSNMDPPTLPIVALTLWEIGLVLLVRPALSRWLQRRRPWTAVVAINGVIMTAFLWHLTVLVGAIGLLYPIGFPQPEVGTASWWLWRPVWLASLLVLLIAFVAVAGGVERRGLVQRPAPTPPGVAGALLAVVGAVATLWGVLGFAIGGLHQVFSPTGDVLIVLRLNPFQNVVHLAWGAILLGWPGAGRYRGAAAASLVVAAALAAAGPVLRSGAADNVLALNPAADLLHAALALVAVVALVMARRPSPVEAELSPPPAP